MTHLFRYGAYRDAFGSDIDYDWYNLTGLSYFELSDHWRVGLRLEAEVADADDPLPPLPSPPSICGEFPRPRGYGVVYPDRFGLVTTLSRSIAENFSISPGSNPGGVDPSPERVTLSLWFLFQVTKR